MSIELAVDNTRWAIRFSKGVPNIPSGFVIPKPGWFFIFPQIGGNVNYITTPYATMLAGSLEMTLEVAVVEAPSFDYGFGPKNPCLTPASVRLYFEQRAGFYIEHGRWWAHSVAFELKNGKATLSVPLDPSNWLSVYGKHADLNAATLAGFTKAKTNVGAVGMTFGGGCFYGHGVSVFNGTAVFIMKSFKVVQ